MEEEEHIRAELSIYPLRQDALAPSIEAAVRALREAGLEPVVGAMSTAIQGDRSQLFAALELAFEAASSGEAAKAEVRVVSGVIVGAAGDADPRRPKSDSADGDPARENRGTEPTQRLHEILEAAAFHRQHDGQPDGKTTKPVREQRDDGCVEETLPAIAVVAKVLEDRQVECCRWLLDAPVSNGGRLGTILREYAADTMDPRSCKPGEGSPLTEPADRLFGWGDASMQCIFTSLHGRVDARPSRLVGKGRKKSVYPRYPR